MHFDSYTQQRKPLGDRIIIYFVLCFRSCNIFITQPPARGRGGWKGGDPPGLFPIITARAAQPESKMMLLRVWRRRPAAADAKGAPTGASRSRHARSSVTSAESPTTRTAIRAWRKSSRWSATNTIWLIERSVRGPYTLTSKCLTARGGAATPAVTATV